MAEVSGSNSSVSEAFNPDEEQVSLMSLPIEILGHIISFLPISDRIRCSMTSTALREAEMMTPKRLSIEVTEKITKTSFCYDEIKLYNWKDDNSFHILKNGLTDLREDESKLISSICDILEGAQIDFVSIRMNYKYTTFTIEDLQRVINIPSLKRLFLATDNRANEVFTTEILVEMADKIDSLTLQIDRKDLFDDGLLFDLYQSRSCQFLKLNALCPMMSAGNLAQIIRGVHRMSKPFGFHVAIRKTVLTELLEFLQSHERDSEKKVYSVHDLDESNAYNYYAEEGEAPILIQDYHSHSFIGLIVRPIRRQAKVENKVKSSDWRDLCCEVETDDDEGWY